MTSDSVVIAVGGNVVGVTQVARQLGITEDKLLKAIRGAGSGVDEGVEAFYKAWLGGELPIPVMPCRSTSLYRFYSWWCAQRGARVLSEVMLLRRMPVGLSKVRRWVKVGDAMKTYTFIEPDDWRPPQGVPLAEVMAKHEAEFSERLAGIRG